AFATRWPSWRWSTRAPESIPSRRLMSLSASIVGRHPGAATRPPAPREAALDWPSSRRSPKPTAGPRRSRRGPARAHALRSRCRSADTHSLALVRANNLEVAGDEDVMGPVDADVVDFVLAVTQLHHPIDDAAGIRGQRGFGGLGRRGPTDDRARPLLVVGWDLTDALGRALRAPLERDHVRRRLGQID